MKQIDRRNIWTLLISKILLKVLPISPARKKKNAKELGLLQMVESNLKKIHSIMRYNTGLRVSDMQWAMVTSGDSLIYFTVMVEGPSWYHTSCQ